MYIVEKIITYNIRDNHTYSQVMSGLNDELMANKICLTLNDQKEHAEVKHKKIADELEALRANMVP